MHSTSDPPGGQSLRFLHDGGELGPLIRAFDWASTPLGPMESWPQSLRTTVNLMLGAPVPIVLLWGREGVLIYNDGYAQFAGRRHPELLGMGAREGWPEIANFNDNIIKTVLGGKSISLKGQELVLDRAGSLAPAWLDLDYAPVRDESGAPAGVLVFVREITERPNTERRRQTLIDLNDAFRDVTDPDALPFLAAEAVGRALEADRVGYGVIDAGTLTIRVGKYWTRGGLPTVEGEHRFPDYGEYADPLMAGEPVAIENVNTDPRVSDPGPLQAYGIAAVLDVPVTSQGRAVAQILVHSATPRTWRSDEIDFVRDVAERLRAEIARRSAERDLAETTARLRFLDGLSVATHSAIGAAEVLAITTRLAGEHLGAAVCAYADMDDDEDGFTIRGDWAAPGSTSIVGHYRLAAFGKQAVRYLGAGQPLVINDNLKELDPEEAATFQAIGISATICMPLIKAGRLTALMAVHHREPHAWTDEELAIIREVTDRSWAHIQRVSAEADLRDKASELEAVLDAVPAVIWVARDTNATRVDGNAFARRLLRTPDGANQSKTPGDGAQAPSHFRVLDANGAETPPRDLPVQRAARGEDVTDYEETIVFDDGSSAILVGNARPLLDASGAPRGAVASFIDITERRRVEAQVRAGEERYRTLFEAMNEGFCIIEFIDGPEGPLSDYVHIEANAAYTKNAGIPDVVGQKVREMVPDEAQGWVDLYKGVLDTGQPIRFEKELEATGRWLELAAFRVEPKGRNQVAVLFKDLTARKQAEIALRDSADNFRTLARAMPNQAWTARPDGMLDWFNERVYAFSGAAPGTLDGADWTRMVHPDDLPRAIARWAESLETGDTYETEFRLRDLLGNWRWHIARAVSIRGETGAIARWIGTNTDIQDQKEITETLEQRVKERTSQLMQAEEALRQSQKMEAVGQLTGGIAHDFNNLLGAISGSLELLEKRIAEGRLEGVQRYITSAQEASRRAASLTQRLLAFSRRQTLDPKPVDVNKLIAGIEDLVRRTVGPTITVEVVGAGGLWATRIDSSQLENSLLNLCINARDAMAPDGGRLTIETANKWLDERAARERELPPGQYISICVTDTGTGMTPDVLARAFDPFFTTKPIGQGTGLGLSMVYGFVRQSNGQVRIYSEIGKGTTMCLYLPRYFGKLEESEAPPGDETIDRGDGETVLVIDDEPILRMLIIDVLEENGYRALEAIDGPSGLKILESDTRIDLLITDVGLPGGMNGRQVADAARRFRPDLKVLFVTGYAENAVVGNGHLDPGMEVLTKPFPVATLGQRIRSLIEG